MLTSSTGSDVRRWRCTQNSVTSCPQPLVQKNNWNHQLVRWPNSRHCFIEISPSDIILSFFRTTPHTTEAFLLLRHGTLQNKRAENTQDSQQTERNSSIRISTTLHTTTPNRKRNKTMFRKKTTAVWTQHNKTSILSSPSTTKLSSRDTNGIPAQRITYIAKHQHTVLQHITMLHRLHQLSGAMQNPTDYPNKLMHFSAS